MKKVTIAVSLLFLISAACFAQCKDSWDALDPNDNFVFMKKNFPPELIAELKATTTVFFFKPKDRPVLDSLRKALTAAWDLTPLIFEEYRNFKKYSTDEKYSYFEIDGYQMNQEMNIVTNTYIHYYMVLRLAGRKNKFCRIELFPNFKKMRGEDEPGFQSTFRNWNPVILRAELAILSANLKNNYRPCVFEEVRDEHLSELLANDTLYVPQCLMIDFNYLNGKEKFFGAELFKDYKYKFRICTDAELYSIFEEEKRGRLLFEYVKSSGFKFISVLDVKDKKAVYKQETDTGNDLKPKDLKKIQ